MTDRKSKTQQSQQLGTESRDVVGMKVLRFGFLCSYNTDNISFRWDEPRHVCPLESKSEGLVTSSQLSPVGQLSKAHER